MEIKLNNQKIKQESSIQLLSEEELDLVSGGTKKEAIYAAIGCVVAGPIGGAIGALIGHDWK